MVSRNKRAVILLHSRGYRVNPNGDVYGLDGKPVRVRLSENGRYTIGCRCRSERLDARAQVHLLAAYQKYGAEILAEKVLVRHLDGNCRNNSLGNILLGSHRDNMLDIPKEERVKHARIAASYLRKYTQEQVDSMRKLRASGISYSELARRFGAKSKSHIYQLVNSDRFYRAV